MDLRTHNGYRTAYGLGWFSIGLGVAEVIAPGGVARLIGVDDTERSRKLLRTFGLREITSGIGLLRSPHSAGWMWSRVKGDMLDLASLGKAINSEGSDRTRVGTATAAVLGVTALDVMCAQRLSRNGGHHTRIERAVKAITINRAPEEIYRFWRNFENLPSIMKYVESVDIKGGNRSYWVVRGPAGARFEWDAEIVEDRRNSLIAWRTAPGSDVDMSGSVYFEPATGGRGTGVRVEMNYAPPGGKAAAKIAKMFASDPEAYIGEDLRALKQVMEVGEVVKSDASIHPVMHPAQPPERIESFA